MEEQIIEHSLWSASASTSPAALEEELDGITEGLEKYVMTKLFDR